MVEFKHPFNEERCLQRLIHEYEKHPELIVAFDFDNTIFDTHENGGDYSDVIELLKAAKSRPAEVVRKTGQTAFIYPYYPLS